MKKDKNRKLHGSVLLTVVFVMSILIIFLFGTLTLALAANNRAHVNYSSAQTEITARAVVDSAIKAIENSSKQGIAYADAIGSLAEGGKISVGVELAGDNVGSYGNIEDIVISHAGKKDYFIFDPSKGINVWEKGDLIKFTATVNMAGVRTQSSAYVLKFKRLDDDKDDQKGSAGFVTAGDADLKTQTSLWGGAYIGVPTIGEAEKYSYSDDYATRMQNRTFMKPEVEDILLKNSNGIIEADFYVNNNLRLENWSGFIFPKKGTGITVLGDLIFENANTVDQLDYYCHDNITWDNLSDINFKDIPFLFVDGNINGIMCVNLGNEDFPMNTFCGSINCVYKDKESIIKTNLYCMDSKANNIIDGGQNGLSLLYDWTNSVVKRVDTKDDIIKGEICTKGNLTLRNVKIDGTVRVEGNLKIQPGQNGQKVEITGDVVCSGTIEGIDNLKCNGTIYYDKGNADSVQVKNLVGYYYEHTPHTLEENPNVYVGPHGFALNDEYFTNGIPNEGVDPASLKIYYTLEYGYKQNDPDSKNHINGAADEYYEGDPELEKYLAKAEDVEPGNKGYYIETSLVPFDPGRHPGKEPGNIKPGEAKPHEQFVRIDGKAYERVPGDEKVESDSFTFSAGGSGSEYESIATYKSVYNTKDVYPRYAEREVLFGLDSSDDKSETKIVKTAQELVEGVVDLEQLTKQAKERCMPMLNAPGVPTIKNNYLELYSMVGSDKILVKNEAGTGEYKVSTGSYDLVDRGDTNPNGNSGEYINKNCILEGFTFNNGPVVFDPQGNDLYIGIKDVNFQQVDIYVDDTSGGTVYFYVMDDSSLTFEGNNCTKTYWDALNANPYLSWKSEITELGGNTYTQIESFPKGNQCPNFYVYGGEKSEMNIQAGSSISTVNIISSELTVNLKAGNGGVIKGMLYDDQDTYRFNPKSAIIGCCNANTGTSDNLLTVYHIADNGGEPPISGGTGRMWWYDTLYYSEF